MENFLYVLLALAIFAAGVIGERLRASGAWKFSVTTQKPVKKKSSGKKRNKPAPAAAGAPAGKRGRPRKETEPAL